MDYTFDAAKNAANIATHGLSFADFSGFDAEPLTVVDDRHDYGEIRYRSLGLIDGKLHVLVHTVRDGSIRLISLRRAHAKEARLYERLSTAP